MTVLAAEVHRHGPPWTFSEKVLLVVSVPLASSFRRDVVAARTPRTQRQRNPISTRGFYVTHLVEDVPLLCFFFLSAVRGLARGPTLQEMCNEPWTIDADARGLTGRDRGKFFTRFCPPPPPRITALACLVFFTRRSFVPPSCPCFFLPFVAPSNNYRACKHFFLPRFFFRRPSCLARLLFFLFPVFFLFHCYDGVGDECVLPPLSRFVGSNYTNQDNRDFARSRW